MSDDYEVGYKKPPKNTQFGASDGNPRRTAGRPKGSKNARKTIEDVFFKIETVRINGEEKRLSAFELSITQLKNAACQGDPRAIDQLLRISEKMGLLDPETIEKPREKRNYGAIAVPTGLTVEEWKAKYEQQENEKEKKD